MTPPEKIGPFRWALAGFLFLAGLLFIVLLAAYGQLAF